LNHEIRETPRKSRMPFAHFVFPFVSFVVRTTQPNSANDRRISFNSPSVMPHNYAAASSTWASTSANCLETSKV
jgi:hypothetical protein